MTRKPNTIFTATVVAAYVLGGWTCIFIVSTLISVSLSVFQPTQAVRMPEARGLEIARQQRADEHVAKQSTAKSTSEELAKRRRKADAIGKLIGGKAWREKHNRELEEQRKDREARAVVAGHYESVAAYFKDAYPHPLTHRFNEPRFARDVSSSQRRRIIVRDGGCCLVCGSTRLLEVDHRIALMNGGDNSDENLGTLCDDCHKDKTRLDWKVKKQRRKRGEYH